MGGMFYLLGLYFAAIAFERMGFGRIPPAPYCSGERAGVRAPSDSLKHSAESKRIDAAAAAIALRWPRWFWPAVLMILMGACAVLTKESHLTFPAAVALLYVCFFRRGAAPSISVGALLGMIGAVAALGWGAAGRADGRIWIALPWAIFILVAGVFASYASASGTFSNLPARFFGRKISAGWALLFVAAGLGFAAILAFPYSYSRTLDALTGQQGSSYVRSLCSQAFAVPRMLLRAIFPLQVSFHPAFNIAHNLNIDHQFPTLSNPYDPRVLWNAAAIFALAGFGLVGAWRGWLASFGVLLAFIVIAPTNTVIERGDIVSERNFYLAAAGGACVLAWLAGGAANLLFKTSVSNAPAGENAAAWHRAARREAALWTVLLACCAAGPFVSFTILRNAEWMEPLRLWESAMSRSPDKMRVLYNYGVSTQSAKKYEESEAAFNRAIQLGEQMSLRGQFRPDEAVDVKCFHYAYARLAELHLQRYLNSNKEDLKALAEIKDIYVKGLDRTAYDPDLAYSYANFLINSGQAASTVPILKKSYDLHTWADQLYLPLGVGSLESGDFSRAIPWLEKALSQKDEHALGFQHAMPDSDRARILFILGIAHSRLKHVIEATAAFREALRLDPQQFLPLMTGLNAVRNLKLHQSNTTDMLLQALSMIWRDMLVQLLAATNDLIATKAPTKITNLDNYKELFDTEIKRRDANQKRRLDAGFTDDPEKDE